MFKKLMDIALRRNTRDQILDQQPRTHGYEARPIAGFQYDIQERPFFNLYWIERMLQDPRVAFGLAISNGLEMALEVEVTGPNPRVNDFVKEAWDRIWETSGHQLMRAECYGYMAYEVMYREERGLVTFDRMIDLYPSDTKPLTVGGQLRAIKVDATRRTLGSGSNNAATPFVLNGMKTLWITNDEQFNNRFGRSSLLPAYPPWYEKNMKGGTLHLRRLRMVKDAWIGDGIKYPENKIYPGTDGAQVDARSIALELQELRASGGGFVLPSTRDLNGNPDWEYMAPTNVSGVTQILECITAIDCEIFDGLLLPREIVEAAETGSGFSGRSIPFVAACAIRDVRGMEKVKQTKAQLIDKLVGINFGLDATRDYELTPKPLIESLGKLMGDMGQPNTQTQGGGPALAQQLAQQRPKPGDGEGEDDDAQFSQNDSEKGDWITIGGRASGNKDHVGGTPVRVHRGKIVSGPKELTGRKMSDIAEKRRPDTRVTQAIRSAAMEWKVSKRDLHEAVDYLWQEEYERTEKREASKKRLREKLGLTAADVQRIDESGKDYSTIKNFDVMAQEAGAELSDLGLGGRNEHGEHLNDDPGPAIWELLKEGKQSPRARHDMDLIEDAARLVIDTRKHAKDLSDDDPLPFSIPEPVASFIEYLRGDDLQFATVDEPRTDKRTTRRATKAGAAIAAEVRGRLDALLKKND